MRQEPENEEVEYIGDMAGDMEEDMEEDEVKEPAPQMRLQWWMLRKWFDLALVWNVIILKFEIFEILCLKTRLFSNFQ